MAVSDVEKVLIIVTDQTIYPALLLVAGARAHGVAADVLFAEGALSALHDPDEATAGLLAEIVNAGGYVYAERAAVESAGLSRDGLWQGAKDIIPLEQFKHHATEHTQTVTL